MSRNFTRIAEYEVTCFWIYHHKIRNIVRVFKKKNLMFCWKILFRAVTGHMHTKRSHDILWFCRKQWPETHKLEIRLDLFHIVFHYTYFPSQLASPSFHPIILVNWFVTQITFGSVMRISWRVLLFCSWYVLLFITSQVPRASMQTEAKYYPRTLEELANPEVGDTKVAHIHTIKAYMWSRGTAPLILNLDTVRRRVVNFTDLPFCRRGKNPFNNWIGAWVNATVARDFSGTRYNSFWDEMHLFLGRDISLSRTRYIPFWDEIHLFLGRDTSLSGTRYISFWDEIYPFLGRDTALSGTRYISSWDEIHLFLGRDTPLSGTRYISFRDKIHFFLGRDISLSGTRYISF